ncbi:MAG TPA: M23 family metallopeptidase [Candidatus Fimivicinus intestinavium]|nr:M23 family metallopeptidase [Candidatus Fimivicinus intestinavium]
MMIKNDYKYTKRKSRIGGKGFYIAMGCCLLAVGLGVWGALQSRAPAMETPGGAADTQIQARTTQPPAQTQESPVNVPATGVADERESTQKAEQPTEQDAKQAYYMLPLGTEINKDFSNGEMVESKTMGDWRVHNGIDFAAKKGEEIKAISSGSVLSVENDSMWGWIVTIDHGSGMKASYCGLEKEPAVKKGDSVKMGDVIGKVGEIPVESAEDPHLHFEVRINGTVTDPLAAMGRAG